MTIRFVCTAAQARNADSCTIEQFGVPSLVLMEHAAMAVVEEIEKMDGCGKVVVVCGPGNNGADGLAVARILAVSGKYRVEVYCDQKRLSADGKIHYNSLVSLSSLFSYRLSLFRIDDFEQLNETLCEDEILCVVDALFGTGLVRWIADPYAHLISIINEEELPVLSIDMPSGIHTDTGEVMGCAMRAEKTICLDCMKQGLLLGSGARHAGERIIKDIGIPCALHEKDGSILLLLKNWLPLLLPERSVLANKGSFGKVLLCGGSERMQGALSMAAKSCYHAGCGTMTLFAPAPAAQAIRAKLDEAMVISAAHDDAGFFDPAAAEALKEELSAFSVAAVGNGMGTSCGAQAVLETLMKSDLPLVVDADGINILASHPEWLNRKSPVILTPHMKEFARLCSISMDEAITRPFEHARALIERYPAVTLVLKSSFTYIAASSPLSGISEGILHRPDAGLAKGGSGDLLCGLITGLFAQSNDPYGAGIAGSCILNQAASLHSSPYTLTPQSLLDHIDEVFARIETGQL